MRVIWLKARESIRKNETPFRTLHTSNYTIDEALTLLKQRCGADVAVSFRNDLERSTLVRVLWVDGKKLRDSLRNSPDPLDAGVVGPPGFDPLDVNS